MNFTVRQWTIISALAAVFVAAALLVSRGDDNGVSEAAAEFDQVAWCQATNAIGAWGAILDGSAVGDDPRDITNLRRALADARAAAPIDLSIDIARLMDLSLLVDSALSDGLDLEAALAKAQDQTDTGRVSTAISRVSDALVACGHNPLS